MDREEIGNAGVIDQNIHPTEGVERSLHKPLGSLKLGDVVGVCNCFTTGGADLLDDQVRYGRAILHGDIVDHDLGALGRKQHRFGPSDTGATTSYDGDFSYQPFSIILRSHFFSSVVACVSVMSVYIQAASRS